MIHRYYSSDRVLMKKRDIKTVLEGSKHVNRLSKWIEVKDEKHEWTDNKPSL